MLELPLVPNYFHCHDRLRLVIEALEGLAEGARPQPVHNFVSVRQVILHHYLVVATVVVVPKVVL